MKPEELYAIVRKALEEGVSLDLQTLIILSVIALLGGFLGSYFRAKGKNLATKEDIKGITDEIESIKAEYAQQLQLIAHEQQILLTKLQQKYDLSVAALEKRLSIHQEAYVLWWKLMGSASERDKVGDVVLKCQDWFVKNSLYLSPAARDAFAEAYIAATIHPDLLQAHSSKEITENFDKISRAGSVLVEAVSLPSWGEKEYRPVEEIKIKSS